MSTALYRRYRPETFADVIGQEHVTDPLRAALRSDRITHAYLFSGPRGCGKTTSARIFARCLNCAEGPTDTPCGTCPSCLELARDGAGSLDVVEMDAASHGGVDDARELRERAAFAPARDRYKIFIIDEAHMVTSQGFNALLKLVEEPPAHVKFVFATTEPEKVIGTIRSRTHHYPFRLVPPERLQGYLEELCAAEGVSVATGVLPLVVRAGGGSVRDSLSVLDQLIAGAQDGEISYERAVALLGYTHAALLDDVVDALAARDGGSLFRVVDRVIDSGHDPRRFAEDVLERFRDLVVIAVSGEHASVVLRTLPQDQFDRMRVQSQQLGPAELSRAGDLVNDALTEMTGATSPRLQLELLCARLLLPSADDAARGYAARLDRIERYLSGGGGAPTTSTAGAAESRAGVATRAAETRAREVPAARDVPPESAVERGGPPESAVARGGPAEPAAQDAAPPELAAGRGTQPEWAAESSTQPESVAEHEVQSGARVEQAAPVDQPIEQAAQPGARVEQAAPADRPAEQAAQPGAPVEQANPTDRPVEQAAPADRPVEQAAPAGRPVERAAEPGADPTAAEQAAETAAADVGRGQAAAVEQMASSAAGQNAELQRDRATGPAGQQPPAPPSASAGQDADLIRRRWQEVLATLARFKRSTWALVSQNAQVGEVSGGVLHLAFATSGLAHTFRNGAHAEPLQQALLETLGVQVRIEPVLSTAAEGDTRGSTPYAAPAAPTGGPSSGLGSDRPSSGWGPDTSPGDWGTVPTSSGGSGTGPTSSSGSGTGGGRTTGPGGEPGGGPEPRPGAGEDGAQTSWAAAGGGATTGVAVSASVPPQQATSTPEDVEAARPSAPTAAAPGATTAPDRGAPVSPPTPPGAAHASAPSSGTGGSPPSAATPPGTGSTRPVARIPLAEDTPSMDDPDAEHSGLVGAPLIERMLGGTVISEE